MATREFYLCGLCDMTFSSKEDCREHTRSTHRMVPAMNIPPPHGHNSEHDSGQASDTTSESLEAPPSKRLREEPSLGDYTDEEILAKLLERNATFVCKCGIIFRDQTLFYLHRGTHSSKNPYECSFCGHVASDWYDFTSHFYFHSKKDNAANG